MRYKITGLSKDMKSVFIFKKGADGSKVFSQRPIRRGISFEVSEDEMSFHVERLRVRKVLKVTPIEEEKPVVAVTPKVEVSEQVKVEVMETSTEDEKDDKPKRSYKKKKKSLFDPDEKT